MNLKDKVAIVTGGGGGIGEAICLCLAKQGAHIVVSDVNEDLAKAAAAKVEATGQKAMAVQTDVRVEADCESMVAKTLEAMGRLDILVCSAGVSGVQFMNHPEDPSAVENLSEEAWDLTMDVNLKGVFFCNRAVIPHFKAQKSGKIINISSDAGRKGGTMLPIYAASKAGVISLTQSIALQLGPFNVNVNSICPGLIWTPMWAAGMERRLEQEAENNPALKGVAPKDAFMLMAQTSTPLNRAQSTEAVGNTAAFLASELAADITGQAINVDGGLQLN